MQLQALAVKFLPNGGTGTAPPGGVEANINTVLGWIAWAALAACIVGLVVGGAKMAIAKHQQRDFEGGAIAMPILAAIVVVSATALISGAVGI